MNGLTKSKAFQDFDQMSIASYASIDNVQSNDKKSNSRDIKIVLFTIILGQLLSIISTVTHYLSFNLLFINPLYFRQFEHRHLIILFTKHISKISR